MTATQVSKAMRLRAYYEQDPKTLTSEESADEVYLALSMSIRPENLAEDGVLTSAPLKRPRRLPSPRNWPRPSNRAARPDVDVPFVPFAV